MAKPLTNKQLVWFYVTALLLGLGIVFVGIRPDFKLGMIVFLGTALVCLCSLIYWIRVAPSRLETILSSIRALRNHHACDREELRQACQHFPEIPDLNTLGALPPDAPIPPDLLDRILRLSPSSVHREQRFSYGLRLVIIVVALLLAFGHRHR